MRHLSPSPPSTEKQNPTTLLCKAHHSQKRGELHADSSIQCLKLHKRKSRKRMAASADGSDGEMRKVGQPDDMVSEFGHDPRNSICMPYGEQDVLTV